MEFVKVSNAFISHGIQHHKALASHHESLAQHNHDLHECHKAIAAEHEGTNPMLQHHHNKCSKLHKAKATAHEALQRAHETRADDYANAASGVDEESRGFLSDTSQGSIAYHAHGAADLRSVTEIDPDVSDIVGR